MSQIFKNRIEEISLCLKNEDLNRSGQRLMDLVYDFNCPQQLKDTALGLRKKYNRGKQLGRLRSSSPELMDDFSRLLETLASQAQVEIPNPGPKRKLASISNISKKFRSRLHNFQFQPISLDLYQGKIIGLVGENGNGKTTLLRMVCGELAPDSGDIAYFFEGLETRDWQYIKKRIAFIPQRPMRWYGTAEDMLSFNAAIKGFNGKANKEKVEFVIHRMGLTNFRELTWPQLSSGYKLRFEIAMALVWDPTVLILDEPLANLDIHAQELLLNDLRNLSDSIRNPVSIILSSQQLHEVETVADQVIFLKNGKAIFNGSLEDFKKTDNTGTFEIMGNFSYADLLQTLDHLEGLKIEQSASCFTINCAGEQNKEFLITKLIEQGFEINYFRNISGSTKKLFNDKY